MAADFESTVRILVTGLLVLAIWHKLVVLARGSAAEEPLLAATPLREEHAGLLMALAAITEAAVAAGLWAAPAMGAGAAAGLLGFYAFDMRRLSPEEDCRCFGSALGRAGARTAQFRNVLLGIVSAAVCLAIALRGRPAPFHIQTGAGAALIVVALAAALSYGGFTARDKEVSP